MINILLKRKNEKIIFLLFVFVMIFSVAIFSGCSGDRYPDALMAADSIADRNPKKAMAILDSIRPQIKDAGEAVKNYYDLLRIKANDEAYVRHTSDTTILRLVDYYEKGEDKKLLPMAYYYAGCTYFDLNDYPEALKYCQAVVDVAEADDPLKYKAYSLIGSIFLYHDLYERGMETFAKAYNYSKKVGNKSNQVHELCGMANCYQRKNDDEKSLILFKKALDLSREIKRGDLETGITAQIADHYYKKKEYITAKKYIQRVINNVEEKNFLPVYSIAADIYAKTGQRDSALLLYKKIYEADNIYSKLFASKRLGTYYLQKKSPVKAFPFLLEFEAASDSVQNIIQTQTVAKINAMYNYSLREKENSALKIKNQQEKEQKILLCLVSLLIIVVSSSLVLWYRHKNKLISLENEKVKLAERNRILEEQRLMEDKILQVKSSEIYKLITKRIADFHKTHETLTEDEWDGLNATINKIYVGFEGKVHNLISEISRQEYRVCMLIKIGIRPTAIGLLTSHSRAAINSTRGRLYEKAYGKKAAPSEWDDLIRSL